MDNRTIEEVRNNETKLITEIKHLEQENQELESQLDFIGYQNKYIDKLEKEVKDLKKQLEVGEEQYNDLVEEKEKLQEQLSSNTLQLDNQQKEFIEYLKNEVKLFEEYMNDIERSDRCQGDYPITYYTSKFKLNEVKEILDKYKEIIGGKDE